LRQFSRTHPRRTRLQLPLPPSSQTRPLLALSRRSLREQASTFGHYRRANRRFTPHLTQLPAMSRQRLLLLLQSQQRICRLVLPFGLQPSAI
jgi:hypothetical protein